MYAVVEIAGKQYKVAKEDTVVVPRLQGEVGAAVSLDTVLLLGGDKNITIGNPLIDGARVTGKILGHGRADKVIVFKKKRRKGYRVRRGHRQGYTELQITKIEK